MAKVSVLLVATVLLQWVIPALSFRHPLVFQSCHSFSRMRNVPISFEDNAEIESKLKQLKETLAKQDFPNFLQGMLYLANVHQDQQLQKGTKEKFKLLLNDWQKYNRDEEIVKILRGLGGGFFSARVQEDKPMLDFFIAKYINSPSWTPRSFPMLLTSMKKLDYRWSDHFCEASEIKERIINLVDEFSNDYKVTGRELNEVLGGIAGLGMNWKNDLKESTRNNLFQRLAVLYPAFPGFDLGGIATTIFTLGRLEVNVQEQPESNSKYIFLQMVLNAVELMQKPMNVKEKGRTVSNLFLSKNPPCFLNDLN
jgi:hypothetical protein